MRSTARRLRLVAAGAVVGLTAALAAGCSSGGEDDAAAEVYAKVTWMKKDLQDWVDAGAGVTDEGAALSDDEFAADARARMSDAHPESMLVDDPGRGVLVWDVRFIGAGNTGAGFWANPTYAELCARVTLDRYRTPPTSLEDVDCPPQWHEDGWAELDLLTEADG